MTPEPRMDLMPVQGAVNGDADRDTCAMVVARVEGFEDSIGRDFRESSETGFRQWRGFSNFKNEWNATKFNDRDGLLYDAKKTWGANLHIPLSFRTVETMIPRALASRPDLDVLPREERYEANVLPVRLMIDRQQEQIDIELEFQDMMRSGAMYGLGVGKTFWMKKYVKDRRVQRRILRPGHYLGKPQSRCAFDDPMFENVDVFDFMWDPFGSSMQTCRWAAQRIWLDDEQVLARISSGQWNTSSAQALDNRDIEGNGSINKYDEVWQARMEASKLPSYSTARKGDQIHEVIEYHDGERVLIVLDRQWLMMEAESPLMGMLPFQIFRPTKIPKQMVGVSELEPIYHLNRELDMLRSQRRDAATLALCAGYAYDSQAIDEEDLVFGPAAAIEVRNANPRDAIFPLQTREPPGTSYEEERVIKADIESVSGLSDQDGGAMTATESQLVQAAVSERMRMKSIRFEREAVRQVCRAFLKLNQTHILEQREIRMPGVPEGEGDEAAWSWYELGPGELRGEFEVIPVAGSMAAPNLPQMRSDAQMWLQLAQNPHVDSRYAMQKALWCMSVKDPEAALKKGETPVPPAALENLQNMGVDPEVIQFAVEQAQQSDPMLAGPNVDDVNKAMAVQAQEPVAA